MRQGDCSSSLPAQTSVVSPLTADASSRCCHHTVASAFCAGLEVFAMFLPCQHACFPMMLGSKLHSHQDAQVLQQCQAHLPPAWTSCRCLLHHAYALTQGQCCAHAPSIFSHTYQFIVVRTSWPQMVLQLASPEQDLWARRRYRVSTGQDKVGDWNWTMSDFSSTAQVLAPSEAGAAIFGTGSTGEVLW